MTIDLIFQAIADHIPDHIPDLSPAGCPKWLRSGWLNGIKHWPVDYRTT